MPTKPKVKPDQSGTPEDIARQTAGIKAWRRLVAMRQENSQSRRYKKWARSCEITEKGPVVDSNGRSDG
jgi:hypothetical protein